MKNALKLFQVLLEPITLTIPEVFGKYIDSADKRVNHLIIWIDDRQDIPVYMKMFSKNWVRGFSSSFMIYDMGWASHINPYISEIISEDKY